MAKIAEAFVEVSARTGRLRTGLNSAIAQTKAATGRMGGSFDLMSPAALIRTVATFAKIRLALDGVRAVTKAMRGDWQGVVDTIERLPFGIGAFITSLREMGEELDETARTQKLIDVIRGVKGSAAGDLMGFNRTALDRLKAISAESSGRQSLLGLSGESLELARARQDNEQRRQEVQAATLKAHSESRARINEGIVELEKQLESARANVTEGQQVKWRPDPSGQQTRGMAADQAEREQRMMELQRAIEALRNSINIEASEVEAQRKTSLSQLDSELAAQLRLGKGTGAGAFRQVSEFTHAVQTPAQKQTTLMEQMQKKLEQIALHLVNGILLKAD